LKPDKDEDRETYYYASFNVVLEVIVRRANLQTFCNKETQLLAYADDIDIVSRSQSAIRNAYSALEEEAAKVGLKINE
jgi:hypothetical protein